MLTRKAKPGKHWQYINTPDAQHTKQYWTCDALDLGAESERVQNLGTSAPNNLSYTDQDGGLIT